MLDSNYLITNRQAEKFDSLLIVENTAEFRNNNGEIIGSIGADGIYAALFCDDVNNLSFVIDKDGRQTVKTVLWNTKEGYLRGKSQLRDLFDVRFSKQNKKLNRYAEEIAKKLEIGVKLQVIDAVEESSMVACPDCGTMSPKGTPFCMDCGAELPLE